MKFRPLHDRVLVRRVEQEAKTTGGIIIEVSLILEQVLGVLQPLCERLKALTGRSILLPITRTAGQPRIRDVRDLGRTP